MKKHLLLLFLLLPFGLAAQTSVYFPFPKDSATWDVRYSMNTGAGFVCVTTFHFAMDGDTVINGKLCSKIFRTNSLQHTTDSMYNPAWGAYEVALREDSSKRIWAINAYDSTEVLLYDFSLMPGDSFNYPFHFPGSTVYYSVTGFDSVLVGSQYRKVIQLNAPGGMEEWIEGIGSKSGLLHYNSLSSAEEFLLCHSDAGTHLYGIPGQCHCHTGLGIFENGMEVTLQVHPNPAQEFLDVECSGNELYSCALLTADGRKASEAVPLRKTARIDVSGLARGMYFLSVFDESGLLLRCVKVMKN